MALKSVKQLAKKNLNLICQIKKIRNLIILKSSGRIFRRLIKGRNRIVRKLKQRKIKFDVINNNY